MKHTKEEIATDAAPGAIGAYSQAVRCGDIVYISGQIPLDPKTGEVVGESAPEQIRQTFANLFAVAHSAGGSAENLAKLTVYLKDLSDFAAVNAYMEEHFPRPFPARAAVQVAALPRGVRVEIDAIMQL